MIATNKQFGDATIKTMQLHQSKETTTMYKADVSHY